MTPRIYQLIVLVVVVCLLTALHWTSAAGAQDAPSNCSYFSPSQRAARTQAWLEPYRAGALTANVVKGLAPTTKPQHTVEAGTDTIDRHIFNAMTAAQVVPAQNCTDLEFIRRVTLDLTGRIPTPERVEAFLAETAADKRAKLIDELLAKPEWVDKWTMFFGGLLRNYSNPGFVPSRGENGRDAFYQWMRDSLRNGKPYQQWVTELLTATGENSLTQGDLNWLTGTLTFASLRVGVLQETYDQQAMFAATQFLGLSHMDCILCHNGRGHLDDISLWGRTARR